MKVCGFILAAIGTVGLAGPARAVSLPPTTALGASDRPAGTAESMAQARTQLESLQITPDGFFLGTAGLPPTVVTASEGDRFIVEFQRSSLSPTLDNRIIPVNQYGVSSIQIEAGINATTRVTFWLSDRELQWEANAGRSGVVLLPRGGLEAAGYSPQRTQTLGQIRRAAVTTIQSVEFRGSLGTQLLVRGDRSLNYSTRLDRETRDYIITLSGARLADDFEIPERVRFSPIIGASAYQAGPETVEIRLNLAAEAEVGRTGQPDNRSLLVEVEQDPIDYPPVARPPAPVEEPPPQPSNVNPKPRPDLIELDDLPTLDRERAVIVIDPGHGGPDPGAVGRGGLQEKDVVLDISLRLARILERQGMQVILTRDIDRDLNLEPRIQLANRINADLFVSVHVNAISMSRPEVNGIETYHSRRASRQSRILARVLHTSIVQAVGGPDRGVRAADFVVIRLADVPAVLLELGFVTGARDAPRLANADYRELLARAVARGILEYARTYL